MSYPHLFLRWRQQAVGLTCSLVVMALPGFAQPKTGDIVFQTDFEGAGTLHAWGAEQNQSVRLAPGFQSAQSLRVEKQTNTNGSASVVLPLPINQMRGARLACCAMVRADGVTAPPQPWNGIKFMLHITTPGGALWPQQNNLFGTFDWKRVQFKATTIGRRWRRARPVPSAPPTRGTRSSSSRRRGADRRRWRIWSRCRCRAWFIIQGITPSVNGAAGAWSTARTKMTPPRARRRRAVRSCSASGMGRT